MLGDRRVRAPCVCLHASLPVSYRHMCGCLSVVAHWPQNMLWYCCIAPMHSRFNRLTRQGNRYCCTAVLLSDRWRRTPCGCYCPLRRHLLWTNW